MAPSSEDDGLRPLLQHAHSPGDALEILFRHLGLLGEKFIGGLGQAVLGGHLGESLSDSEVRLRIDGLHLRAERGVGDGFFQKGSDVFGAHDEWRGA
jgi:hypothetical protein